MNLTELITELAAADGIGHIGAVREVAKKYWPSPLMTRSDIRPRHASSKALAPRNSKNPNCLQKFNYPYALLVERGKSATTAKLYFLF